MLYIPFFIGLVTELRHLGDVEMYSYVVVRLSHSADAYILDLLRDSTLSSVIDDHVMT